MITGMTRLIAHIGYPTHTFKSPMIYNPYFQQQRIDAVVVPFASQADTYPELLRALFSSENVIGALITMPHKITTTRLVDRLSITAQIAGSCNAVRLAAGGKLEGDMFDGEGFVRSLQRKNIPIAGKKAIIIGNGGVGCAIAASLAREGIAQLTLFDSDRANSDNLAKRLNRHYPDLAIRFSHDPSDMDIVINATPLGMYKEDPMPVDLDKITQEMFIADVVLSTSKTAFLHAVEAKGCLSQNGNDMLFEQIPVYLDYFGLPSTTAAQLRKLAQIND